MTPLDVNDLGKHIGEILAQKDCADFVSKLIATAATTENPAHSTDASKLFDMIVGGKGGYFLDNRSPGGGGTTGGSIREGDASVYISYGAWPWAKMDESSRARAIKLDQYTYAIVGLHETLHLATRYGLSDRQLAR